MSRDDLIRTWCDREIALCADLVGIVAIQTTRLLLHQPSNLSLLTLHYTDYDEHMSNYLSTFLNANSDGAVLIAEISR